MAPAPHPTTTAVRRRCSAWPLAFVLLLSGPSGWVGGGHEMLMTSLPPSRMFPAPLFQGCGAAPWSSMWKSWQPGFERCALDPQAYWAMCPRGRGSGDVPLSPPLGPGRCALWRCAILWWRLWHSATEPAVVPRAMCPADNCQCGRGLGRCALEPPAFGGRCAQGG